jgi:propionyl-CoA carboxylase alpha chain
VRVDGGVDEGAEIGLDYDPMIAKVMAHGATRAEARTRLRAALDGFYIRGPRHNTDFLAAVLTTKRFAAGTLSTNFIAEEFPHGFAAVRPPRNLVDRIIAVAALAQFIIAERDGGAAADWVVCWAADQHAVTLTRDDQVYRVAGQTIDTDWRPGQPLLHARFGRNEAIFQIDRNGHSLTVTHAGVALTVKVLRPRVAQLLARMPEKSPPDLSRMLLSPMPGLLVSIAVAEGQQVHIGDELAVVEAMKMMNVLRAERDGQVKALRAQPGASLGVDQIILEFV